MGGGGGTQGMGEVTEPQGSSFDSTLAESHLFISSSLPPSRPPSIRSALSFLNHFRFTRKMQLVEDDPDLKHNPPTSLAASRATLLFLGLSAVSMLLLLSYGFFLVVSAPRVPGALDTSSVGKEGGEAAVGAEPPLLRRPAAEQLAQSLNRRFREGRPAHDLADAGVLVRVLDAHQDGHFWGAFARRKDSPGWWSASVINANHPDVAAYWNPGFVLAPEGMQSYLSCSYSVDRATVHLASECTAWDPDCLPGCGYASCTDAFDRTPCHFEADRLKGMMQSQDHIYGTSHHVWKGWRVPNAFGWNEVNSLRIDAPPSHHCIAAPPIVSRGLFACARQVIFSPPPASELPNLVEAIFVPLHELTRSLIRKAKDLRQDFASVYGLELDDLPILLYDAWDPEAPFRVIGGDMVEEDGEEPASRGFMDMVHRIQAMLAESVQRSPPMADKEGASTLMKALAGVQVASRTMSAVSARLVDWAMSAPVVPCGDDSYVLTNTSMPDMARAAMPAVYQALGLGVLNATLQLERLPQHEFVGDDLMRAMLSARSVKTALATQTDGIVAWLAIMLCVPSVLHDDGVATYFSALTDAVGLLSQPEHVEGLFANGSAGLVSHFVRGISTRLVNGGLAPEVADEWHATASERLGDKLAYGLLALFAAAYGSSQVESVLAVDRAHNYTACSSIGDKLESVGAARILCSLAVFAWFHL